MFKVISVKSAILSLGITTIILPIVVSNISLADEKKSLLIANNREQTSIVDIFKELFRKRGGSPKRPNKIKNLCMVWPDPKDENQVTWSDRPTFVWKGQVTHIAIKSDDNSSIVWERDIVAATEFFSYPDEKSLERGKKYNYTLTYGEQKEGNNIRVPFTVMDENKPEFLKIANFLENQKSSTQTEALALQEAQYFNDLKTNLKADAVRVIFSVKTNNSAWHNAIKEAINEKCESSNK